MTTPATPGAPQPVPDARRIGIAALAILLAPMLGFTGCVLVETGPIHALVGLLCVLVALLLEGDDAGLSGVDLPAPMPFGRRAQLGLGCVVAAWILSTGAWVLARHQQGRLGVAVACD